MGKEEAKKIFREYIKKQGLRNTRQREEILDVFLSSGGHITVDELFDKVKKRDSSIGYATVHRNLNLLLEAGLAEEIKIGKEKTRYEQMHMREHHDHLICLKCGKFIEVVDENIENLQKKLAEKKEFFPVRHKLEIYGYCKRCRS
ncbi:MAG: transcriptional repressor [Thermodesulfovibrionales bacterium]|nr:transcriptional repressor [Thermodesulfovibrionales bacterium]